MPFLKMSHIKIKRKDIHKILSYISTLYESSTDYMYIYILFLLSVIPREDDEIQS